MTFWRFGTHGRCYRGDVIPSAHGEITLPHLQTQFLEKAEAVKITIGGAEIIADKREFSLARSAGTTTARPPSPSTASRSRSRSG